MGCASSTRRSVRVEQEAWDGVAPGQPRQVVQQGPSPAGAAVAPPQAATAAASAGSNSDVARESGPACGSVAEPLTSRRSLPAAVEPGLARSAPREPRGDADPAHLKPRGDQPSQTTPRVSSANSAPHRVDAPKDDDLCVDDAVGPRIEPSSPHVAPTEKNRRSSESREHTASTDACEREAAEVERVLSEAPKAPGDADSEKLDQEDVQEHRLVVETTESAGPKRVESPCTAADDADANAAIAMPTSAPVELDNQSSTSSASVDVLDNSVCVAIDAEQFSAPDAGAIPAEAALLNEQRHFTRRDTFDPYEADAALRQVLMEGMVVSELPTLDTSYSSHAVDSDDDSDGGEDEAELILDVRAARQRVAAAREPADVHQAVRQNTTSKPPTKKIKSTRGVSRMREASWKVLELLMSPQKPNAPANSPVADRSGNVKRKTASLATQRSRTSAGVVVEKGSAEPEINPMLIPLAISSPLAKGSAIRSRVGVNALDHQKLSSLPPFRSCSGTSTVSSVPSAGIPDEEQSPLTFSANEEAIMDAILGI